MYIDSKKTPIFSPGDKLVYQTPFGLAMIPFYTPIYFLMTTKCTDSSMNLSL